MKLVIRPGMPIGEVQKNFNDIFPYLKLEFYKKPGDVGEGKRMNVNGRIGDADAAIAENQLEIWPAMTVKELESGFKKNFSLTVQVFRQSGTAWLQTTITDKWSLQRQNEHGREISTTNYDENNNETPDYDLDRDTFR